MLIGACNPVLCPIHGVQVFRTAMAMLENLQDELYVLDASVAETKIKYDAAFKNIEKVKKSKSTKKRTNENELKKLITTCQFTRQEYLLETAAANRHYLKFRNEQLPQVLDACNEQNITFCTNYFKAYASLCSSSLTKSVKNMAKVDKLASRMAAPLERRTFLHEVGKAFPGRQLFEIQPHPDDATHLELKCDNSTRNALVQMRELLKHSCDIIDKGLREKEKQMDSLQSLRKNYQEAGTMFDKQQPKLVEEKMEVLSQEIETDALKRSHLQAKISRITEAGVDDVDKFPQAESGLKKEVVTMDLKQAQARETERRTRESTVIAGPSMPSTPAAAIEVPGSEQSRKRSRGKSAKKESKKSPCQTQSKLAAAEAPMERKTSPRGVAPSKPKTRDPDDPGPPPTAPPRRSMMFDVGSKPVIPAVKGQGRRKSRLTEVSVSGPVLASQPSREDPYEVPSILLRRGNSYHGVETETDAPETYDVPETTAEPPQVNYDVPEIDESFPPPPPAPADDDIDLPPPPSWAIDDLPPPDCFSPTKDMMMDSFCDLPPPPSTPDAIASGQVTPQKSHRDASAALYEELVESDTPLLYRALYTYEAAQNDDIGIGAGDLLYVLVARDDGWCQGISLDGQVGFFPASYVERETARQTSIEAPRMLWLYPNATSYGLSIEGTKPVKVKNVYAGTPAEKAGVREGDIILEINEEPFADKSMETITAALAASFENKNKATKLVVMNVGSRRCMAVAVIVLTPCCAWCFVLALSWAWFLTQ